VNLFPAYKFRGEMGQQCYGLEFVVEHRDTEFL